MEERERKVSKKEGAKGNGLGEEGEQTGRSKGNGLGERERKYSKNERAKEMDWEEERGRLAKRKEQRKCIGRKGEEGEQKGRCKGYELGERERKVSKKGRS